MYRIRSEIDGRSVWFQGLLVRDPPDELHIAWTTIPESACSFGLYDAAEDTAKVLLQGTVERY